MPHDATQSLRPALRDRVGRLLYRLGLTRPARAAAGLLTVATLHRVLPEEALADYPLGQIAVSVPEFAWMLAFLREHFTCETLAVACRRWAVGDRPGRPLLALTFDDGQLDNFVHARPVLEEARLPATFFVPVEAVDRNEPLWHDRLAYAVRRALVADHPAALQLLASVGMPPGGDDRALAAASVARSKALGERERRALVEAAERLAGGPARPAWDGMMSWEQLRALAAAGHEIGSHSLSHPLLTGVEAARLEQEVAGSRHRIRNELGVPCESFCYPNGTHDERVVETVRRAGYRQAVVTAWGPNRRGADLFRLTRCDLQGRTSRDRAGRLSAERLALRLSFWFARVQR